MIIDTDKIKALLDGDITSYRIARDTGLTAPTIDNYRVKGAKLENMTLKIAKKLYDYALEKESEK